MRSLLERKETASAAHRYELIVEDLTWTEAYEACEEKGGYLATLTSWEEFRRVQEQIVLQPMVFENIIIIFIKLRPVRRILVGSSAYEIPGAVLDGVYT